MEFVVCNIEEGENCFLRTLLFTMNTPGGVIQVISTSSAATAGDLDTTKISTPITTNNTAIYHVNTPASALHIHGAKVTCTRVRTLVIGQTGTKRYEHT